MTSPMSENTNPGLSISVTGAIIVASVAVIFSLFVFFVILYLRSNLNLSANHSIESSPTHFAGDGRNSVIPRALRHAVLMSLPVIVFSFEDFKDGVECSVCLSELTDGELLRLLPGCYHGFHLDCIDLWFSSNSTCPVCRSSVELSKNMVLNNAERSHSVYNRALQIDCSGEGSSRRPGRVLAVEIPINAMESSDFELQSRGIPAVEEVKSQTMESERSVKRIVTVGSKGVSSGCCSRGCDVEQGLPPPPPVAGVRKQGEESSSC